MRTLIVRAAMLTAFMPAAASAQSLSLTESEALARLSADSPRVQAIRASVDIVRADVLAASRWLNPRLTINRESTVGITEYIATIGQVLPITGRRGLAASAASAHADAVSARADEEIRRVRTDLRLAFADLVAAQSREGELSVAVLRARELAGAIAKREAAGDAAGFDRLRAEREALDVDADGSAVAWRRENAQAALAAFFVGPSATAIVAVSNDGGSNSQGGSTTRLHALLCHRWTSCSRARRRRAGELRALQQEIASAEFAERAATRGLYPEPEIVAGTKSSSAGGGDIGSVFAVHVTLPLFDRAKPERAIARARAAQARARADAFRAALRAQIAALRAAAIERRAGGRSLPGTQTTPAPSSNGSRRSATTPASAAFWSCSTPIERRSPARVCARPTSTAARGAEIELEFVSGWEIQ